MSFPTFSRNSAAVVAGDFNEDGKQDLAVPGALVGIDIWLGNGAGVFIPGPTVVTGNSPLWLTVANFNADGHLDLLADDRVVLGTGTGSFSAPIVSPFVENSVFGLAADVNNDTHVDVVSVGQRGITIMLGNGTGNLTRGRSYISGAMIFGFSTVLGDFNQDGKVDLAATQPSGVGILDGDGTGAFNDALRYDTHAPAPSENHVLADFSLTPGTALSNVDYLNLSGFAGFAPGTVTTTIAVPIVQDNIFEPDETFSLNLSNPTNVTIADGSGLGTITNDDTRPAVSISSSSIRTEGGAGTSVNAQFDVTLSNPAAQIVPVSFFTLNESATAGSDYVATSGTLTFNPGETSKSISIEVTGDNVDETDEVFFVLLTNSPNAFINADRGLVTIVDDDGPTLSIGSASVMEGNTGFVSAVFTVTLQPPALKIL